MLEREAVEKYALGESIFIVWGGNISLAKKVSNRLQAAGLKAQIGGNSDSETSNYYLGPRVVDQMKRATHAIILANPSLSQNKAAFRENLMFEWGFLLGRLPPTNIHVYLIDCTKSDLPSDLHGARTFIVPHSQSRNVESAQSRSIVKNFQLRNSVFDQISAFDVLINWECWKNFMIDQLNFKSSPQPTKLRRVIRYAFIPLAYYDERDEFIPDIFQKIDYSEVHHVQDLVALQGLYKFLKLSRNSSKDRKIGDFDAIKRSFSYVVTNVDSELAMITRYAMGLCLMAESFHIDHTDEEARRLRRFAIEQFKESLLIIYNNSKIKKAGMEQLSMDLDSKSLWKSYLFHNLAKAHYLVGDCALSPEFYKGALQIREQIQQRIDLSQNKYLSAVFHAETLIHTIRYKQVSNDLTDDILTNIERNLHVINVPYPHQFQLLEKAVKDARNLMN